MNQISEAFQAAYPYVLWNGHGVKTKSIISNITIKESEKTRLLLTKKYKPTKNISNKQICRREKEHYKYSIKMWMCANLQLLSFSNNHFLLCLHAQGPHFT